MFLEYLPGSIPFKNPLDAHDRARELAKLYWRPFVVVSATDGRYHVSVFYPPPGHDNRTQVYTTVLGCMKEIFYPPREPDGAWRAQTMADTIEIEVTVMRITDKAYLVELENLDNKTEQMWLPKSQVKGTDCLAEGDEGTMEIAAWLAKQKGLLEDDDE
jgi:hypothetical protein